MLLIVAANLFVYLYRKKPKEFLYHVKIKFAHGIKTKLILNSQQYEEEFLSFLKQVDGYFEIGDEVNNVKLYREFICAVEVKKK